MENIQVVLRVRPQNPKEVECSDPEVWRVAKENTAYIDPDKHMELVNNKKLGVGHRAHFSYSKKMGGEGKEGL